jgi:hypothetical protein
MGHVELDLEDLRSARGRLCCGRRLDRRWWIIDRRRRRPVARAVADRRPGSAAPAVDEQQRDAKR